jgi:hypothetical protein
MKQISVHIIAEIAMVVALSTALSSIKIFELPQGACRDVRRPDR